MHPVCQLETGFFVALCLRGERNDGDNICLSAQYLLASSEVVKERELPQKLLNVQCTSILSFFLFFFFDYFRDCYQNVLILT